MVLGLEFIRGFINRFFGKWIVMRDSGIVVGFLILFINVFWVEY